MRTWAPRLERPTEIAWSIALSALAGVGAYVLTYRALVVVFHPAF
jgi:hypothetical protein